jgi:hypothetical protein
VWVSITGHDIRHLGDAEQRGDARRDVLAERRRRCEYMAVPVLRNGGGLRRVNGGERVRIRRVGDRQHLRHAVDLCRLGGDWVGRIGEHKHVDRFGFQLARTSHAARRARIEFAVQMFGDDQDLAHQISPLVFSAATSSAASFTITPLLRLAGGAYAVVFR